MNFRGERRNLMAKQPEIQHDYLQNIALFGDSLFFKGELSGKENIIIRGQFSGKIDMKNHDIIIDKGGNVEAEIQAKNIIIRGIVRGNICASGKVFIEKDAKMIGDISASRISMMDGAQFKGSVKMVSNIQPLR